MSVGIARASFLVEAKAEFNLGVCYAFGTRFHKFQRGNLCSVNAECLESGTNSRRSAGVWKIYPGNNFRKRISERRMHKLPNLANHATKRNISIT